MKSIVLLTGYRGTGKDTFYRIMSNKASFCSNQIVYDWKIYTKKNCNMSDFVGPFERVSFADQLKKEVHEKYGVPIDADKELKQFHHNGELVSARDLYIKHGAERRDEDPDYWCKIAEEVIKNGEAKTYVFTDWRFKNEKNYLIKNGFNVITARLYRKAVVEPELDVQSEHELDDELTDMLIVPQIESTQHDEFYHALERFPQYKDHIPC